MEKNNEAGATEWVDPDDAPEITEDFFEQAEVSTATLSCGVGAVAPRQT
jgi:hypothetical protein